MRVLLRADATAAMGTGHVMRSLALAAGIVRAGGDVTLAAARLDEAVERRIRSDGIGLTRSTVEPGSPADAAWVADCSARGAIDWVVADGYAFGESFQRAIRESGRRLLLIDDYGHLPRYAADLVLNQNLSADERLYGRRAEHTRLLLGPSYALLREEFRDARAASPAIPRRASRVLVTMGGADQANATAVVVSALARIEDPELSLRVVLGPSNPHAAGLRASFDDPRIEWLAPAQRMAQLMRWADLAVAAAGITTLELCCIGVPALLVVLADNQQPVAAALAREGIAENLGWHHGLEAGPLAARIDGVASSPVRRREMVERGRARVDGRGVERVVEAMRGEHDADA